MTVPGNLQRAEAKQSLVTLMSAYPLPERSTVVDVCVYGHTVLRLSLRAVFPWFNLRLACPFLIHFLWSLLSIQWA